MNLIMTMCFSDKNLPLYELCRPTQINYAKKTNCDYLTLYNEIDYGFLKKANIYRNKIRCLDYLKIYDRVLFLDGDVMINKHAGDIFAAYPKTDTFYAWTTDDENMLKCLPAYNLKKQFYFNGGVYLIGKDCNMQYNPKDYQEVSGWDEVFMNYIIQTNGVNYESLSAKWNRMSCNDVNGVFIYDSNFIHFGGHGWSKLTNKGLRKEMELDKYKIAETIYRRINV